MYLQNFSLNEDELEIIGYRGHTCEICLINHPLAVYVRRLKNGREAPQDGQQELLQIVPTKHGCDFQRALAISSLPIETRKVMIADLNKRLPESVMNSVNGWTKNQNGLISFEVRAEIKSGFSSDLFPEKESHWSVRTIKNRRTAFKSDEEMMDFICSASNATAGLFNVHTDSKKNGYNYPYFIAIYPTHIPGVQ